MPPQTLQARGQHTSCKNTGFNKRDQIRGWCSCSYNTHELLVGYYVHMIRRHIFVCILNPPVYERSRNWRPSSMFVPCFRHKSERGGLLRLCSFVRTNHPCLFFASDTRASEEDSYVCAHSSERGTLPDIPCFMAVGRCFLQGYMPDRQNINVNLL